MNKDIIVLGKNKFETLVARTPLEHLRGLMFKEWPPPIMSFPYSDAGIKKFWMKNTPSPLDIIFCYAGKIVDIIPGNPYETTLIGPDLPVDLVVELPKGTAFKYGINIGDPVNLQYSSNQ